MRIGSRKDTVGVIMICSLVFCKLRSLGCINLQTCIGLLLMMCTEILKIDKEIG